MAERTLRKKRAPLRRAGVLALEIVGAGLAAVAGVAGYVLWRVEEKPLAVPLATHAASFAIERAFPAGHDVIVGAARLSKDKSEGDYVLTLDDVSITDDQGEQIGRLARVEASVSLRDALHGDFGLRRVKVVEPFLRIVRGADGRLSLDYRERDEAADPDRNLFRLLTGGETFRGAFKSAVLEGAQIEFHDVMSGKSWRATDAHADIARGKAGYDARIEGAFDIDGKAAALILSAVFDEAAGEIDASLAVQDAPLGDILDMFYGENAAVLSAPVSGEASLRLTKAGEIVASRISGRASAGALLARGRSIAVNALALEATFDPKTNRFDVARFDVDSELARGRFAGVVGLRLTPGARLPAGARVDFVASEIVLFEQLGFESPVAVSRLAASLDYDRARGTFSVADAVADLLGVTMRGAGAFEAARASVEGVPISYGLKLDVAIDGALDRAQVLAGWPKNAAKDTRDFVATRVPAATARAVKLHIDAPAGERPHGGRFPDDALELLFEVEGATVDYAPGMTPLTKGRGQARLSGDRFFVEAQAGEVGAVKLSGGEVEFTSLRKDAPVHFRFAGAGSARAILETLNAPPLSLLSESPYAPDRFSGDARFRVDIMRPNRKIVAREDWRLNGAATFSDLSIADFWRGEDLNSAAGTLNLKTRAFTVNADAQFAGAPIAIVWRQPLFAGPRERAQIAVDGVFDDAAAARLDAPWRSYARGPTAFKAEAEGLSPNFDSIRINVDLTQAAVDFPLLAWSKPAGAGLAGAIDLTLTNEDLSFNAVRFDGGGVDVRGQGKVSRAGGFMNASFDAFVLPGAADLALAAAGDESGAVAIDARGRYLNAGPLLQALVEGPSRAPGAPDPDFLFRGAFDSLAARGGANYRDLSIEFSRKDRAVSSFSLAAHTRAGAPLSLASLEGADASAARRIRARTDDVGALIAALFDVRSVRGGSGVLNIALERGPGGGLSGDFAADGLRVVGAPLLARVFSAGSLTGLSDLLNGDGIEIQRASGDFAYRDRVFSVDGARASGPSVGITAQGNMTAGGGALELHGAVAPAYQVNSFLGRAPVIGDLLIGREGEGVVALSYDVTGRSDNPSVSVNPLSALAPGMLRRLFEPRAEPSPADPPAP